MKWCIKTKHFDFCEFLGAIVGMFILLSLSAPAVMATEYLYYRYTPAEHFVNIEYINASDVTDGEQSFVMCRWMDKERVGTWTWEMSNSENERVFSSSQGAIMEMKDDCIVKWTTSNPYIGQAYKPGVYHWDVIVTFDVEGIKKQIKARSNNFNIK